MKKIAIAILGILLIAGGIIWLNMDNIIYYAIKKSMKQAEYANKEILLDKGIHVITLGTGLPAIRPDRTRPCTAVIAGGQILIFDAGLSSSRQIGLMKLPWDKISAVFLTHLHSDHFAGLGALMEERWIEGKSARDVPLKTYGPVGTKEVGEGFEKAYRINNNIRIHALFGWSLKGSRGDIQEFTVQGNEKKLLYDNKGLRVFAFTVDHFNPAAVKKNQYKIDAYGYRIEYGGRAVVLSGDSTFKSRENMVRHSRNADLLLHEANLDASMSKKVIKACREMGMNERAEHVKIAISHHTTPIQAAVIANEANVKKLVLHHLPISNGAIQQWLFLRGTDKVFKGDIVLSEDFMDFYLPPVSTE